MKTVINIKTDKEIKEMAQKTAGDLGLSLSALINAYLRQFVRTKEAHFTLSPQMSPALENLLGKVENDIQRNKNISRGFSSSAKVEKYLSSL